MAEEQSRGLHSSPIVGLRHFFEFVRLECPPTLSLEYQRGEGARRLGADGSIGKPPMSPRSHRLTGFCRRERTISRALRALEG